MNLMGNIGKTISRVNNLNNNINRITNINNVTDRLKGIAGSVDNTIRNINNTVRNVNNTINTVRNIGKTIAQGGNIAKSGLSGLFKQSMSGETATIEVAEFYITQIETQQKLQLSMPPESVNVKLAPSFRTFNIIHLGEIKLPRGEKLSTISWNGILPGQKTSLYGFVNSEAWVEPTQIVKQIESWGSNHWEKNTSKLRLMITQTVINLDVYLENFSYKHVGGMGNIEYNISFINARELTVQTVKELDGEQKEPLEDRPSTPSESVTVKSGDTLWGIAQQKLGDGSRWQEIYNLNKDKISNPDLIYPGQEFQMPAK